MILQQTTLYVQYSISEKKPKKWKQFFYTEISYTFDLQQEEVNLNDCFKKLKELQ